MILAELSAVKQDFEQWKLHEHIVKMNLQGLVDKFKNRCASMQAQLVKQQDTRKKEVLQPGE